MQFHSRVFALAKDTEQPQQYEDSYALDAARGIAVVADGVSSAIFSRAWANILTEAVAADPPNPFDPEGMALWLQLRRQTWHEQIDTTGLAWFQKAKMALGAFSTLLWVQLSSPPEEMEGAAGTVRLQCFAIGDSCLLHIRDGQLVRSFPIQHSSELEANPVVLGSLDLNRDHLMQFVSIDELCYPGDLLILCTDAVADWALRSYEAGIAVDWDRYWEVSEEQWVAEIVDLRNQQMMRYDDATMMLLQVCGEPAETPAGGIEEESLPTGDVEAAVEAEPDAETCAFQEDGTEQPGEAADEIQVVEVPVDSAADIPADIPRAVEVPEKPSSAGDAELTEMIKSASDQITEHIDQASDKMLRGLRKLRDKAVEKYQEKFGEKDE